MVALRDSVFISHATPEDNAFTLWLGGRLTALGYHVFADILRLKGGDDWERILEDAIRQRAKRFLLVGTPGGIQKQGVRNEINLAVETAKKIGDGGFIVPLRLAAYPPPLQIAHTQYINFEKGWAQGLAELLPLLEEANVPRHAVPEETKAWQNLQLKDARSIDKGPEQLVSNWLDVISMPTSIAFFDFKSGISIGAAQKARADCPIPIAVHNRGLLAFAPLHQLQEYFGPNLPIEIIDTCDIDTFLSKGWRSQHLAPKDCRSKFTDIVRRALDAHFASKGLRSFEYASGRLAWWATARHATLDQHTFAWTSLRGRRQLVGRSEKRGFYWHYAVNCLVRSSPLRHVRVTGRVVFTSNGQDLIGDPRRLHRMRRTFCKGWRNDKWRDLLLAFWHWISDGAEFVDIALGEENAMRLSLPPRVFTAPFGISSPSDALQDDQDDDALTDYEDDQEDDEEEEVD
ncbi:toll/interleukin-1 receptor domain-containing protein [Bradyrhizobium sp. DASA03068]|uniref:toll/interleukin-1 receptor domain-containing protein n=1 Tax=Bradyrhizobium sp. BLXBL-01 TaxID=3395915 RepID=UPI003F6F2690